MNTDTATDDSLQPTRVDEVDTTQLDKATIRQLRKNVERLKTMQQIDQMKKVSHFNLGAFFPLGKK